MRAQDMDGNEISGRRKLLQEQAAAYSDDLKTYKKDKKELESFFHDDYQQHAASTSEKLLQDVAESNYKSISKAQNNSFARSSTGDIPDLSIEKYSKLNGSGFKGEIDARAVDSGIKVAAMGAGLASGSVAGAIIPAALSLSDSKSLKNIAESGSSLLGSVGNYLSENKAIANTLNDSAKSAVGENSLAKAIGSFSTDVVKSTVDAGSRLAGSIGSAASSSIEQASKMIGGAIAESVKTKNESESLKQTESLSKETVTDHNISNQLDAKKNALESNAPAELRQHETKTDLGSGKELKTESQNARPEAMIPPRPELKLDSPVKAELKSEPKLETVRTESRIEAGKQNPAAQPLSLDTKNKAETNPAGATASKAEGSERRSLNGINAVSTETRPVQQAAGMSEGRIQQSNKVETANQAMITKAEQTSRVIEAAKPELNSKSISLNSPLDQKVAAAIQGQATRNAEIRTAAETGTSKAGRAELPANQVNQHQLSIREQAGSLNQTSGLRSGEGAARTDAGATRAVTRAEDQATISAKLQTEASRTNNNANTIAQRAELLNPGNSRNQQTQNQGTRAEVSGANTVKAQNGLNVSGARVSSEGNSISNGMLIRGARIESSNNRYLTGVEAGLLIAAVGIAKARSRAQDGQKNVEENRIVTKSGKEISLNHRILTEKPGRQLTLAEIAGTARRFPGKEITLSTVLALSGNAKIKDIEHSVKTQNKPGEHNLRIEKPLDPFKERKTDAIVPSLELFSKEQEESSSENPLDHLLGILPAAPVFLRARGRSEFLKEDDSKVEPDDETANQHKTHKKNQRQSHRIKSGESLLSIAESRLNDENLAWLIADINKEKISEHFIDGRRIVEIQAGQKLELPLSQEIAGFYNCRSRACDPDNLITIVVEAKMDRKHIEAYLQAALGLRRSAT